MNDLILNLTVRLKSPLKWMVFGSLIGSIPCLAQSDNRWQVNKRTLNFFLPVDHLSLPCFMPIEIRGAYNSYAGDSSLFGQKWTFNHNIRVTPDRTRFKVLEGDGFENYYTREKNLAEATKALIEQLLIAQKKVDSKAGGLKDASTYEELKRRLTSDQAFRDEQESKLLSAPKPLGPGMYYSFSRGPSTLELKPDGTFIRTFQSKATESFNKDGQITKSIDKYGNSLVYTYAGRNLLKINDSCSGSVSFTYKSDKALEGLVDSIRDSLSREIKYEVFPNRRLKSFKNIQKELTEFTYDNVGNMKTLTTTKPSPTDPTKTIKETIEVVYNAQFEVQKLIQGSHETRYSRSFVANNQSHSISEISEFEKGKPQSREVQEVKLREFEILTKFDGKGTQLSKETKKLSPATGYPVSVLDEKGAGELVDYDADTGNPLKREIVPNGDTMIYEYNKACNQVAKIQMKRPGRGSGEATFKYDPQCNPIKAEETQASKKVVEITIKWNEKGKISYLIDELAKKEIAFTYWKFGKTESITLKDVGTLLVKYLPGGDIEKVDTFAHGKGKDRFGKIETVTANGIILQEVKGALDSVLGYLRQAGVNIGL